MTRRAHQGIPPHDGRRCRGPYGRHHPHPMKVLDVVRPAGVASDEKVFGLSESQIARRVKAIARAAGLSDWEFFSGHSGRVGMARRMAQNGAPHPRDRTPGPLETGRRHGRSLHPRRVRRVCTAISVKTFLGQSCFPRGLSLVRSTATLTIVPHASQTFFIVRPGNLLGSRRLDRVLCLDCGPCRL